MGERVVPIHCAASTGPRPRGRGMLTTESSTRMSFTRFNGAAPARARNGGFCREVPLAAFCFNGAAPARARNVSAPGSRLWVGTALQRGRARAGAECDDAKRDRECATELQRGRARAGAECGKRCAALAKTRVASTGPRPRGRGMRISGRLQSSVDTSLSRFNGAAPARARNGIVFVWDWFVHCSFNGAAPARARNAEIDGVTMPSNYLLQRGRARAGAECKFTGANQMKRPLASTGPRPRGRGMPPGGWKPDCSTPCFNGAAPARARNGPGPCCAGRLTSRASTGPRPRGRGMKIFNAKLEAELLLQRGRARAGAE